MKLTRKLGALLFGTALLAAAAPLEMRLKAKDQQNLGKEVRSYYDAFKAKKDIAKAKVKLVDAIAKQNKKLSKKAKTDIDLLASPEDLQAIFAASQVFPKRSVGGKVVNFSADTFLGEPVKYSLVAPKGYKASKGALPLILIIPSESEDPGKTQKDPGKELDEEWMLGDLRGNAVLASLEMPADPGLWGRRGGDQLGGLETVMFALRDIRSNYSIDADQIFLAGHGAGVGAAVEIANVFPYIFAGVIGRSGDLDKTAPTNFRDLPTLFAGGGSAVTAFEDAAKELGYENVNVKPDARLEDIWKWVQATRRDSNPSAISFAPTTNIGGCYWLTAEGFDPEADEKPELTAEIDREKNVIAITSKGISKVTLMLNDALVDLDKEVLVICNGVEHKDTFRRNLTTALEQFFNSNDAGRIYTAFQVYDLPEPKSN
jgi:hypothetical protein